MFVSCFSLVTALQGVHVEVLKTAVCVREEGAPPFPAVVRCSC